MRTKPAHIILTQIHRYNTITQDDDDDGCTVVAISMEDTVGSCCKVKWDHNI